MDSTLIAALIGAAGGGVATAAGGLLRTHSNARTAARLIYAELTRNSTAVAYYRRYGHWAAPAPSRTAWDDHGPLLARKRDSGIFEAVLRGYEALEAMPFITGDTVSEEAREDLARDAVRRLVRAITEIGEVARISKGQIRAWTQRLELVERSAGPLEPALLRSGVVPPLIMERMTDQAPPQLFLFRRAEVYVEEGRVVRNPDMASAYDVKHVVFDARWGTDLDSLSTVARSTGHGPVGDPAVDEAYEGLVATSKFLSEVFGRQYVTTPGEGPIAAVVHYDRKYNNAFWNGEVVVFGDGDDRIFTRFSKRLDIIGVEVWKGIGELRLIPNSGQPGALHNSICDVFGVLLKQYSLDQTADQADWLLGAGLLAPGVHGRALRSLKDPGSAYDDAVLGTDQQPRTMDGYQHTEHDNGGVHLNSGIPNHAFYLVAERLGGKAWERAGQIWWAALTSAELDEHVQFADFARLTATSALRLYGEGEEQRAVLDAWSAVGVLP
ncbi:M4 family metallopeptidase [Streptomyces sp. cg40]|uniref:M4 family metallopeptidase n=1 Tax=Streptomyces sp. cg40 TaxID=3419764 RepID=UPI003CFE8C0B